jgi:hypothetical protein
MTRLIKRPEVEFAQFVLQGMSGMLRPLLVRTIATMERLILEKTVMRESFLDAFLIAQEQKQTSHVQEEDQARPLFVVAYLDTLRVVLHVSLNVEMDFRLGLSLAMMEETEVACQDAQDQLRTLTAMEETQPQPRLVYALRASLDPLVLLFVEMDSLQEQKSVMLDLIMDANLVVQEPKQISHVQLEILGLNPFVPVSLVTSPVGTLVSVLMFAEMD